MAYGPPWVCSCGVQNWQSRQKCYGCGGDKPVGQGAGSKGEPGGNGGKAGKDKGGPVVADASVLAPWAKGPPQLAISDKVPGDLWPPIWEVQGRRAKRKQRQKAAAKGAGKGQPTAAGGRSTSPGGQVGMEVDEGSNGSGEGDFPRKDYSLPESRYTDQGEWKAALAHWEAKEAACRASPTLAPEGKEAAVNVAKLQGPLKPTPEELRSKEIAALQSCNAREISLKEKIAAAEKDIEAAKKLLRQYEEKKEAAQEALDGVHEEQADLTRAIETAAGPPEDAAFEGKTLEQLDVERIERLAQVERVYQAASDKIKAALEAKELEEAAAKFRSGFAAAITAERSKTQQGREAQRESEDSRGKVGVATDDGSTPSGTAVDRDNPDKDRSRSPARKG